MPWHKGEGDKSCNYNYMFFLSCLERGLMVKLGLGEAMVPGVGCAVQRGGEGGAPGFHGFAAHGWLGLCTGGGEHGGEGFGQGKKNNQVESVLL